ncbi:MAG: glycine zipper family protein [Pikeienuella sp.]
MRIILLSTVAALTLTACGQSGADYVPLVDQKSPAFGDDLAACQSLAQRKEYFNDEVKSEAAKGAVVGGALTGLIAGIDGGSVEDGIAGLLIGGLIGGAVEGGAAAWDTSYERRDIVVRCMQGRGHNVLG